MSPRPAAPWCDDPLCQCSSLPDHQSRGQIPLGATAWLVDRLTAGELQTYNEIVGLVRASSDGSANMGEVRTAMFTRLRALPESTLIGYAAFVDQALAHLQNHDASTLVASILLAVTLWR